MTRTLLFGIALLSIPSWRPHSATWRWASAEVSLSSTATSGTSMAPFSGTAHGPVSPSPSATS